MAKNKQSLRSFIAFMVTWAFIILTISGIVLYVVPQGRIAYWVHWSLGGLGKEQWADLHMIFGGLFIVTGIWHLWFNWKPFKKYFAERAKGHFALKREVYLSVAATFMLGIFSVMSLPPVSWVFDLNDWLKASWVISRDYEPPFGHAEEASLVRLSKRMDIDLSQAVSTLRDAGYVVTSQRDSLEKIARMNQVSPMDVYAAIRHLEKQQPNLNLARLSAEAIEARFTGTGIGRKSLAEMCEELGIPLDPAIKRLKAAGFEVSQDDSLRSLAEQQEVSPIEVLKLMLLAP